MKRLLILLAWLLNRLPKTDWKPIPLCRVYGKYGLNAPNLVGHVTAPTVTTGSASSITYNSFTMGGTISDTGGENASTRGFAYMVGTSGDPTTSNSVVSQNGSYTTGAYSLGLTGLTHSTSYRVRAYAINSGGTAYGTTVTVTTSANVAPTVTPNSPVDASTTSDTTPALEFTGSDTEGNDIRYNIQVDTSSNFDSNVQAYNISAAVATGYNFTPSGNVYSADISPDGTKLYVCYSDGTIGQYPLSTPYRIDTAGAANYTMNPSEVGTIDAFSFSHDGTKLYLASVVNDIIYQYALGTAWDLSTVTYTAASGAIFTSSAIYDFTFNGDGTKLYVAQLSIDHYSLSTAWDISTATNDSYSYNPSTVGVIYSIYFTSDGMRLFLNESGTLHKLLLSSPWDVATMTPEQTMSTSGYEASFISNNGVNLYLVDRTSNPILGYSLKGPAIIRTSGTDPGFINTVNGADTDPFTVGQKVSYTPSESANTTYYFNASVSGPTDSGSAWTDDANAFDGLTSTFATMTGTTVLAATGTTAPSSGGAVSSVLMRFFGGSSSSQDYTSYTTLTAPSGGWSWSKLRGLTVELDSVSTGSPPNVVTYVRTIIKDGTTTLGQLNSTIGYSIVNGHNGAVNKVELLVSTASESPLSPGTYYWRVRGVDPTGSNSYGGWSATRSFTISSGGGGTTGQVKVWNGSSWVAKPVKVWNGSSWVTKPAKRWNGSSWVTTNY